MSPSHTVTCRRSAVSHSGSTADTGTARVKLMVLRIWGRRVGSGESVVIDQIFEFDPYGNRFSRRGAVTLRRDVSDPFWPLRYPCQRSIRRVIGGSITRRSQMYLATDGRHGYREGLKWIPSATSYIRRRRNLKFDPSLCNFWMSLCASRAERYQNCTLKDQIWGSVKFFKHPKNDLFLCNFDVYFANNVK